MSSKAEWVTNCNTLINGILPSYKTKWALKAWKGIKESDQIRSVAQPGLPVQHQLPEFTETHVHRVSNAIQPSHPLSSPSPPAPIPPSIRIFSNESTLHMRCPEYRVSASASFLPKKSQSWSPCSPRDFQESSPTPQFKSINSSAFSLLHSPTLTSIHDHRKNHSLD